MRADEQEPDAGKKFCLGEAVLTNLNRRPVSSPRRWFLGLALAINFVVTMVPSRRRAVQIAGSLDLVITVSALY